MYLTDLQSPVATRAASATVDYSIADAFREWNRTALREAIERTNSYREVFRTPDPAVIVSQRTARPLDLGVISAYDTAGNRAH